MNILFNFIWHLKLKILFSFCPVTKEKYYKMRFVYLFRPEKKSEMYERMNNYEMKKKRTRLNMLLLLLLLLLLFFSWNFLAETLYPLHGASHNLKNSDIRYYEMH